MHSGVINIKTVTEQTLFKSIRYSKIIIQLCFYYIVRHRLPEHHLSFSPEVAFVDSLHSLGNSISAIIAASA